MNVYVIVLFNRYFYIDTLLQDEKDVESLKNYSLIKFLSTLIIITASLSGIWIALYEKNWLFKLPRWRNDGI